MRIAQIAPLAESVPPRAYGGTERIVYSLTEELVRRGHDVTLFASGDSRTSARLVPCCRRALRLDHRLRDRDTLSIVETGMAYARADEFDVIHSHIDAIVFPTARLAHTPTVSTTHGRLDEPAIVELYENFPDAPLVSISDAQRSPLPRASWVSTVYNGIDLERYTKQEQPGDYLAFLGRISPEKRPDLAIRIAQEIRMPLRMAAKVDPKDRAYFEQVIKPMLSDPIVDFIGEIGDAQKNRFLGGAYAYLFPIDWPEPFGITMVEAMATGTPVIAMNRGSVPEVVVNGRTGYICSSLSEMIEAVAKVPRIPRQACREHVARHYTVQAMTDGYEAVYRRLTRGREVATGES